jgi:hypothetical protein
MTLLRTLPDSFRELCGHFFVTFALRSFFRDRHRTPSLAVVSFVVKALLVSVLSALQSFFSCPPNASLRASQLFFAFFAVKPFNRKGREESAKNAKMNHGLRH